MADLLANIKNDNTKSADNDSERVGTRRGQKGSHIEVPIRSSPAASSPILRKVRFEDAVPCSLTEILKYPLRKPLTPPLLVELQQRPTTKHEGSKNFVSRLQPRAVVSYVAAEHKVLSNSGVRIGASTKTDVPTSPSTSLGHENILHASMEQRLQHAADLQEVCESLEAAISSGDAELKSRIESVERSMAARWDQPPDATLSYDCIFWFLSCPFRSTNITEWESHHLTHFAGKPPTGIFECHLCPPHKLTTHESADGHEAWKVRMQHYIDTHARTGWGIITVPPPDMLLFQYLRETGLVTEKEYKVLVTKGWLAETPRMYVQSRVREKRSGKKKGEVALGSLVRDVQDTQERLALRSVLKHLGLK
jgi:hypothetical protein